MENYKTNGIRNQAVTKEIKKSNEAVTNHFFLHVGFLTILCLSLIDHHDYRQKNTI
jgi:hypothetical protein